MRRAYRRWADGDGWGYVLEAALALVLVALLAGAAWTLISFG